jgi:hypothetical protein
MAGNGRDLRILHKTFNHQAKYSITYFMLHPEDGFKKVPKHAAVIFLLYFTK